MGWQQLDLEISVCAALAQMSPEVARDPKLATMASSYLGACAQSPSEVKPQTLEAALDLGLHSVSADAAGSLEAVALVARVACEACASIYVGGSSGAAFPASGPKALRLAWASLRALGHHGRSSLSPAPTDFHRVASALTSALEATGRGDAAPIEAARALSLWLEPVHAAAMLSSEEGSAYVARLKRALAKLAVTTGTRCQPECVSVAASLAGALGPRFALNDPEEGRPLRPEGLPFLSLLTAKTEISLLLSDALQPGEAVAADFGQTLEGLTMTAGERCAQRLPPCLALLEHSLEVLVECERGGGGGGGKASQDLCAYFELAHEVVGVVGQFLRERAKAEGFGDMAGEGSVELACCRALGGFLMECPEAAGEAGKGVGGGLVAATELGPPRELGQVAAQSSALFGWTYLAPSLSLLREESTPVELSGASLRQLSRLVAALSSELRNEGPNSTAREGKLALLRDCLALLCGALGGPAHGLGDLCSTNEFSTGFSSALAFARDVAAAARSSDPASVPALLGCCDLACAVAEAGAARCGADLIAAALGTLPCVTRLLVAEFNARLAVEVPEGATAREWRELVDYLAYLLREREAKTT